MRKNKLLYVFVPIVLFFNGCGEVDMKKCSKPINVGKMIKNVEIATSFNDSVRSRVETESGVFIIRGTHSMLKTIDLSLITCDNKDYLKYKDSTWKIRK